MGDRENKSGYQLRTDLLGMAIGVVDQKVQRLFENEHMKPEGQRNTVDPFTTEDVIVEAEKLYAFVQKKQTRNPQGGMGLQMPRFSKWRRK